MKVQILVTGILTKTSRINTKKHEKNPFPKKGLSFENGFTLIEILVVVFIIGIMVGVFGLRIGGSNERVVLLEAKRFIHVVNEVQDEAVLSGKPYALAFNVSEKSYSFLDNPPDWKPVLAGGAFKLRRFPEIITVDVDVEKIENSNDEIVNDESNELSDLSSGDVSIDAESEEGIDITPKANQVLISPLGEVSPFNLTLSTDDLQIQISLNEEQRLEAKKL